MKARLELEDHQEERKIVLIKPEDRDPYYLLIRHSERIRFAEDETEIKFDTSELDEAYWTEWGERLTDLAYEMTGDVGTCNALFDLAESVNGHGGIFSPAAALERAVPIYVAKQVLGDEDQVEVELDDQFASFDKGDFIQDQACRPWDEETVADRVAFYRAAIRRAEEQS